MNHIVFQQRHDEGFHGFTVPEGEGPGGGRIIDARRGGADDRGVVDRNCAVGSVGAENRHHEVGVGFHGHNVRDAEAHLAGRLHRVIDREDRRYWRQQQQVHRVAHHTERIGQQQAHGAVTGGQRIVQYGYLHLHDRGAWIEDHPVAHGQIIRSVAGGAVRRGHKIHRDRAVRAALAEDVNQRVTKRNVFIHRIDRGGKADRAVVVDDVQHRDRLAAQACRSLRIGKRHIHCQIGRDHLIIKHRDRHCPLHLADGEDQRGGDIIVVDAIDGRVCGSGKIHRDAARAIGIRSASPTHTAHGDHRVGTDFIRVIISGGEPEAAGASHGAAINPHEMRVRHIVVGREATAQHDRAIRLHGQRGYEAVRARAKIDGRIHRATGQEPRDAATGHAVGLGEQAA